MTSQHLPLWIVKQVHNHVWTVQNVVGHKPHILTQIVCDQSFGPDVWVSQFR